MKKLRYCLMTIACMVLATSCEKNDDALKEGHSAEDQAGMFPEGYFVATFDMGGGTRSLDPTIGPDSRVQHIRYIIFNAADGSFVKERAIWGPANGTPQWPLDTAFRDTLPNGDYTAVFFGNVEASLFPQASDAADVLTGYQSGYADTRIALPSTGLNASTEYYMGKAALSDASPAPEIWLQRIVGGAKLHRNTIDAQEALNMLVDNIFDQIDYRNILTSQLEAILTDELTNALGGLGGLLSPVDLIAFGLLGGVDAVVGAIVQPLSDALLDPLLTILIDQIGAVLAGNNDQGTVLEALGMILNPWAWAEAGTVIATIDNFPSQIDLDMNITATYQGKLQFALDFEPYTLLDERDIFVRGFGQGTDYPWNILRLNVIKAGLVSGLVVDGVADGLLLPGALVDINDPVTINPLPNIRFQSNFSLVDLGLKDYTQQTEGTDNLGLSVRLGDVANLSNILTNSLGILGDLTGWLLGPVISLLENITITVPVNLPLLSIDNLQLSGGWGTPVQY